MGIAAKFIHELRPIHAAPDSFGRQRRQPFDTLPAGLSHLEIKLTT